MKILRFDETDLSAQLASLSAKLGFSSGMVSADSSEKTIAVFGEALSPIDAVRGILADVQAKGDAAVIDYAQRLDGATLTPATLRVSREELAPAYDSIPSQLKDALAKAKENIWQYQEHIKVRAPSPMHNNEGGILSLQYRPLNRVGIYVPGGQAAYPSTVLMTAVPAQVAGVKDIVMVTPCGPEGVVRPETLAAAHEVGLHEVYRIGGAQAIGALAYGTETIPRVDKIVGPGNLFVTLAKREVYGQVDLDMLAGPSEVLIIADDTANPRFLAADLLSQAEHNPAASVLLTPNPDTAEKTLVEIEAQLQALSRGAAARECLDCYSFVGITRDLDQAVDLANQFAPEHLELAVKNPKDLLPKLYSAGAIFVGSYTPEPVGDYLAGPSHVLPTGGTARFFSGLNVNDFLRRSSHMLYTAEALRQSATDIDVFARAEGLDAHARSATIRFEDEGTS